MLKQRQYQILVCCLLSAVLFGSFSWIHIKASLAQLLIERAWLEMRVTGETVSPWPWADFWPVARIHVKKNGKVIYVLSSASGEALAFGPGHVSGSAFPATAGTSIIAAHRDTHFKFLKDITIGDVLTVQRADGASKDFQVAGIQIVDVRYVTLKVDTGRTELKLVTCFPFDAVIPGGPKRLVVQLLPEDELVAG